MKAFAPTISVGRGLDEAALLTSEEGLEQFLVNLLFVLGEVLGRPNAGGEIDNSVAE